MKICELDPQYQDYLKDPYATNEHKLKSVEMALQCAKGERNIEELKTVRKVLKRRVTLEKNSEII